MLNVKLLTRYPLTGLLILCYSEASPLHGVFYPSSYPKLFLLALRVAVELVETRARRYAPAGERCRTTAVCLRSLRRLGASGLRPSATWFRLASFFLLSYLRLTCVLLGARLRLAAVGQKLFLLILETLL